ncbi:MAG: hypothetical protein JSV24_07095 [Bacteroidales bacterium]|nr:MAG: hypothetical protein JSV24_07095 [Bacteroidales bacterium]
MSESNSNDGLRFKPLTEQIRIDFNNPDHVPLSLRLFDNTGRLIRSARRITGSTFIMKREGLQKGIYLLTFSGIKNLPRLIILN